MKKRLVDIQFTVIPNYEVTKVPQPSIRSLDLPAFAIAPEYSSVLGWLANPICLVRHDQLDASFLKTGPQWVAIIRLIANHPTWFLPWATCSTPLRDSDGVQRCFREFDFRWRGRSQVLSQRNTLAIDHHHPLCTLAPLGFADACAPFFAGAKLPSINASLQSKWPF